LTKPAKETFAHAAGLLLALVTLLALVWLSREVMAGRTEQFDALVRARVHQLASPALTLAMRGITILGSAPFLVALGVALTLRWHGQGRRRLALLFAITLLGGEALEQALKFAFHRARPEPFFGLDAPSSYSFPSGHALMSCCFYGVWAAVLRHRHGVLAWILAAVLVAAIGISRIYLGVHYPSDVIAGYAAAVVWILTVRSIWLASRRPTHRTPQPPPHPDTGR